MIKNSFRIFKNDLKKTFTNYAAIIVILALALIPSLYAWFNIKACWDPYSAEATGQIRVAMVNKDKGTVLNDKEINIGKEVVDELKNNKTLGWVFMSEEESKEALEQGKIYAAIEIDEKFSEDITSFITSNIEKGKIIYSVNEKINAIAPKITSKGATAIQDKVNTAVVETVSKVVLTASQEAGYKVRDDVLPRLEEIENALIEVEGKFGEINSTVDNADTSINRISELLTSVEGQMPEIRNTVANSINLTNSVRDYIVKAKEGLNGLAPTIKQDLAMVNSISKEISNYVDVIKNAVNNYSAQVPQMIASLKVKLDSANKLIDSLLGILENLNNMSSSAQLQEVINNLKGLKAEIANAQNMVAAIEQAVNNGGGVDMSKLNTIKAYADDINAKTSGILSAFDTQIVGKINQICDEALRVAQDVLNTLQVAQSKMPDIENIITKSLELLKEGDNAIDFLKENLPMAEQRIVELKNKIAEANNSSEIKDLLDFVLNDVEKRSEFLADPVEIEENDLFPMGNYGSAMTPFYSVLCLWVGATLLVSILSVDAHGAYNPVEVYLGKLYLFVTIGIMQATIVALGDLYLLKIYCLNPGLFLLGLIYTAMVCTTVVYTLTSIFGNVGKVIGIILLVLQVAGSGGTFPIQLTPRFFQIINPYLPFTYAISMEREAIGGVVEEVLYKDIGILALYIIVSIIAAIILKKFFNKIMAKFTEKFEESGLGE